MSRSLAAELNHLGICVEGELIDLDESSEDDNSEDGEDSFSDALTEDGDKENEKHSVLQPIKSDKLFLDITCMVAYVSSMTNGGANFLFPKQIYNQQVK